MDNKRLILNVAVVLAVFFVWQASLKVIYKRHPTWPGGPQAATQPVVPATAVTPAGGTNAEPPTTGPAGAAVAALHAEDAGGSGTVRIGSATAGDPAYPMCVEIDPAGAGLASVTLNGLFDTAKHQKQYAFQTPIDGAVVDTRPLATRSVTVDGREVSLATARWRQTGATADSATFACRVVDGPTPLVELTKTFKLQRRDAADKSEGYDVAVAQTITNLTKRAVTVATATNGPTPPAPENSRSEDRRFIAGFDEGDQFIATTDTFVTDLGKTKPAKDLAVNKSLPLVWVGTCNSYFDAIVRPDAGATGAVHVASAMAVGLDDTTHDAAFSFATAPVAVPAGASVPFDVHAFFGPKQRALLNGPYYSAFPRKYDSTLVYTSGYCGFLTFGWLITGLYSILWFFHAILRDWGLAIIGLVLLVRTCLHPITKRAQVNMMGMSKMGPEIERLKKKHGDDKDALNKAMMGVYKEQGLTPILGCLPMLLQTPIWLALWAALQSTFEIRQAPFLHFGWLKLTWISDLSQPDALYTFANPIHVNLLVTSFTLHSINVLPVLLAGVFFVQQMMQPVPANQTPEQEQQRKMMRWMSLMYPIFFYVSPSGLNLYILTSTSIGIVESRIVRQHIKDREEAEKSGRIIVDAPKKGGGKAPPAGKRMVSAKQGGTGVAGWLAGLQAKAEEMVREAERRKGEKKG